MTVFSPPQAPLLQALFRKIKTQDAFLNEPPESFLPRIADGFMEQVHRFRQTRPRRQERHFGQTPECFGRLHMVLVVLIHKGH